MEAYIYDHVRTPRGKGRPDGALHEITSVEMASQLLVALKARNNLDTALLDDVIIGMAQPVGEQGGVLARAAVLHAGYAETVAGQQIHRFCATGLDAVNLIAAQVHAGMIDAGIGGGVESMSRTVMGYDSGAWTSDPQIAYGNYYAPQGIGADIIATLEGFSREDVDNFAVASQRKAAHAWENGYFKRSIVPVKDVLGEVVLDHDEHMRPGTTLENLAKLKPAFEGFGKAGFEAVAKAKYPQIEELSYVHHGGNSSGIVDGSGLVLVGSKAFGEKAGLKPRGKLRAYANIGSEPTIMLTAPTATSEKALKSAGIHYRIVASQPGDWTAEKGMAACQNILQSNPDVQLFFNESDDMVVGCARAVRAAGSHAKLIGMGGSKLAIAAIRTGQVDGTVCYKPENLGALAFNALYDDVTGKQKRHAAFVTYDTPGITKANLSQCVPQW